MRIESIEIKNFRQYLNQTFKFPYVDGQNDLHIIYAMNGVGKTNVMNAITWCLYDSEMHLGDRNTAIALLNEQYTQKIRDGLAEGSSALGEASVSIMFSSDDAQEKIRFQRVGRFNVNTETVIPLGTDFTVMHYMDGDWNSIVSDDDTLSFVNKTVPEGIHDYIFFDGEHLESYFKSGQFQNVQSGIEELTQANIIQKAQNAFLNYIKTELKPKFASSSQQDIANAQADVDETQGAIETAEKTIQEYKGQILKCDNDIAEQENIISGHPNVKDKTDRLKVVEGLIEVVKMDITNKRAEMMIFAREYVQYFALYPSIKSLYKYIKEQDKHGKLPPRIDKFLLESIEKQKHCCVCDQDLNEHSFNFIQELKKELEVSSETSALLNKTVVSLHQYLIKIDQYKNERNKLFDELQKLKKQEEELLLEEKQLNAFLMNIPNPEAITAAINLKNELRDIRDKLIAKKGIEEEQIKKLSTELETKKKKLKSLIEKNQQLQKYYLQEEYCTKCSKILSEVREELLEESRKEMEEETFKTFTNLIWKKNAFSRVEILEDYTFRLLNNYGNQTLGSCSAAERALLALSFTLALQKVSTHDSLLFIDTPIGRVDEENRINFINTLCEIAKSKQVILTFTPTEYDSNVEAALTNQYASFSHLKMSDGITKIN